MIWWWTSCLNLIIINVFRDVTDDLFKKNHYYDRKRFLTCNHRTLQNIILQKRINHTYLLSHFMNFCLGRFSTTPSQIHENRHADAFSADPVKAFRPRAPKEWWPSHVNPVNAISLVSCVQIVTDHILREYLRISHASLWFNQATCS